MKLYIKNYTIFPPDLVGGMFQITTPYRGNPIVSLGFKNTTLNVDDKIKNLLVHINCEKYFSY